jgi:hypothetical protein
VEIKEVKPVAKKSESRESVAHWFTGTTDCKSDVTELDEIESWLTTNFGPLGSSTVSYFDVPHTAVTYEDRNCRIFITNRDGPVICYVQWKGKVVLVHGTLLMNVVRKIVPFLVDSRKFVTPQFTLITSGGRKGKAPIYTEFAVNLLQGKITGVRDEDVLTWTSDIYVNMVTTKRGSLQQEYVDTAVVHFTERPEHEDDFLRARFVMQHTWPDRKLSDQACTRSEITSLMYFAAVIDAVRSMSRYPKGATRGWTWDSGLFLPMCLEVSGLVNTSHEIEAQAVVQKAVALALCDDLFGKDTSEVSDDE